MRMPCPSYRTLISNHLYSTIYLYRVLAIYLVKQFGIVLVIGPQRTRIAGDNLRHNKEASSLLMKCGQLVRAEVFSDISAYPRSTLVYTLPNGVRIHI